MMIFQLFIDGSYGGLILDFIACACLVHNSLSLSPSECQECGITQSVEFTKNLVLSIPACLHHLLSGDLQAEVAILCWLHDTLLARCTQLSMI